MVERWRYQYKCRNCGEIKLVSGCNNQDAAIAAIIIAIADNKGTLGGMSVQLMSAHVCSETQCGVSDLIGVVLEGDNGGIPVIS